MEPLSGLDGAFLALETATARFHVGAVLVLDRPAGRPVPPAARFTRIRRMIEQRLDLVPQFRQRAVRVPFGLVAPMWVDDPGFDLDDHVRRASVPAPGGRRELDELVAEVMAQPLPTDRPLWEMLVVEGLSGDRSALVAKLHHAILDGVSGASTMAAFLDLTPDPAPAPDGGAGGEDRWDPPPLPSVSGLLRHAVSSLLHQPEAVLDALDIGADALVEVAEHNRHLAAEGLSPPPTPFHAPRTPFNGTLPSARSFAAASVSLDDVTRIRRAVGPGSGERDAEPPTFNDVVLCAAGMAADRYLQRRGDQIERPLVALVPVSTRPPTPPVPPAEPSRAARAAPALGNRVSGMLVELGAAGDPPLERLHAVAEAGRVAKEQEQLAWGRLLDGVARATPPAMTSWAVRAAGWVRLFDRVPPLFNLAVSTIPGPEVPLWVAGQPVVAAVPVGPVGHGVGLNVTSLTHHGTVHLGLLASRRHVPDVGVLAGLLVEAVAELGATAAVAGSPRSTRGRPRRA